METTQWGILATDLAKANDEVSAQPPKFHSSIDMLDMPLTLASIKATDGGSNYYDKDTFGKTQDPKRAASVGAILDSFDGDVRDVARNLLDAIHNKVAGYEIVLSPNGHIKLRNLLTIPEFWLNEYANAAMGMITPVKAHDQASALNKGDTSQPSMWAEEMLAGLEQVTPVPELWYDGLVMWNLIRPLNVALQRRLIEDKAIVFNGKFQYSKLDRSFKKDVEWVYSGKGADSANWYSHTWTAGQKGKYPSPVHFGDGYIVKSGLYGTALHFAVRAQIKYAIRQYKTEIEKNKVLRGMPSPKKIARTMITSRLIDQVRS